MAGWEIAIAVYGALLATGHLSWTIWRSHRERGRLTLSWHMSHGVNKNLVGTYLAGLVTIVNTGSKPIFIGSVKCGTKNDDFFYAPNCDSPGKKLEPGEWITETFSAELLLNNEVSSLWAEDSLQRKYLLPSSGLAEMQKILRDERTRLKSINLYPEGDPDYCLRTMM